MPSRKAREHLGDSWVVEGEDESSEESPRHEREVEDDSPPPRMTPGRPTRSSNRSPAPEFVMPPLDPDTLEASWGDSTSRSTRFRRDRRPSEQGLESRRRSSRHTGSSGSPEKRPRTKTKDTYKPSSTITSAYLAPSSKGTSSYQREPSAVQDIVDVTVEHGATMLSWIIDILGGALRILKTPLSYLLAVWLLFGLIIMAHNLVTSSVYASLSPICRVPGVYYLNLPFCPVHSVDNANGPPPPVEFDQLMKVQAHFEEVLEESAGGVSLPLDMKRGEASIRDLRQLVRYSQLQSKNELVLEFDGFIETARIASYDLQKFNSHVGRAVDSVIATTKWTTRVLDGIQERDAGRGSINSFINDKLLAPFQPIKFTEGILLDQYIQHTHIVEEEINKLISEAQAMLMVLNSLEDRLEVISNIAMRDDIHTKKLKEDILSELWTMVGGNRSKVNKMDRQLALLQQVSIYRKTAYAHVSGTIIRLQAIGAGLEDLRERVGSPELLRDRVHIPLSVHIENIQKGVERLEETRSNARKLENDQIRLTLERGQLEGTLIGTSSS